MSRFRFGDIVRYVGDDRDFLAYYNVYEVSSTAPGKVGVCTQKRVSHQYRDYEYYGYTHFVDASLVELVHRPEPMTDEEIEDYAGLRYDETKNFDTRTLAYCSGYADGMRDYRDSGAARNHIPDAGKKVEGWTEKEKIEFKRQLLDAAENGFNATEKRLDQLMELYLLHNGIEKFTTLALRSIKRYAWAESELKKLQGVGVVE